MLNIDPPLTGCPTFTSHRQHRGRRRRRRKIYFSLIHNSTYTYNNYLINLHVTYREVRAKNV